MSVVQDYSPAGAEPASVAAVTPAPALNMLSGDEIVQLSIKPSLWFIPIVSAKWVLTMGLLATIVGIGSRGLPTLASQMAFQTFLAIAALRLAIGAVQWASRLYVLTNRRVMRFKGIFSVEVRECLLTRISGVELRATSVQRLLRLGSIQMPAVNNNGIVWEHIARPAQVKARLEAAIRRAQFGEP